MKIKGLLKRIIKVLLFIPVIIIEFLIMIFILIKWVYDGNFLYDFGILDDFLDW